MKDSVEARAMERATKHYEDKAWKVTNVSHPLSLKISGSEQVPT
jgi:hypothetical protein